MDPDMVRQQAEAEREALALLRKKPATPAPASAAAIPHAILTAAAQARVSTAPHEIAAPRAFEAGLTAGAVPQPAAAALPEVLPPEPQAAVPAPQRVGASMAAQFGRFISFGLAGAMLGGGLWHPRRGIYAIARAPGEACHLRPGRILRRSLRPRLHLYEAVPRIVGASNAENSAKGPACVKTSTVENKAPGQSRNGGRARLAGGRDLAGNAGYRMNFDKSAFLAKSPTCFCT